MVGINSQEQLLCHTNNVSSIKTWSQFDCINNKLYQIMHQCHIKGQKSKLFPLYHLTKWDPRFEFSIQCPRVFCPGWIYALWKLCLVNVSLYQSVCQNVSVLKKGLYSFHLTPHRKHHMGEGMRNFKEIFNRVLQKIKSLNPTHPDNGQYCKYHCLKSNICTLLNLQHLWWIILIL